jgi:hypothetical protein
VSGAGEVRAIRVEGPAVTRIAFGTRLMGCLDQAREVADEYGLRAVISCEEGRLNVHLKPQ